MKRYTSTILLALLVAGLAGCSIAPVQSQQEVVLQDPLPGKAIVYLIRAPNDGEEIEAHVGSEFAIALPPSTYSVLSVTPGPGAMWSSTKRRNESRVNVSFFAGERRFFYLSGSNSNSIGNASTVALIGGPLLAAINQTNTVEGSRTWKECSEVDARGLMSISKLVLPR